MNEMDQSAINFYGDLWRSGGAGMIQCVLCGRKIAWRYAQARVSHARGHMRRNEATERHALLSSYHDVKERAHDAACLEDQIEAQRKQASR